MCACVWLCVCACVCVCACMCVAVGVVFTVNDSVSPKRSFGMCVKLRTRKYLSPCQF